MDVAVDAVVVAPISLLMVALAALILVVEGSRHHQLPEAALLVGLLAAAALAARWLLRDLRAHPSNFPTPTAAHGLGLAATGADGRRPRSRWSSQSRTEA
jgi:hypothetical protein